MDKADHERAPTQDELLPDPSRSSRMHLRVLTWTLVGLSGFGILAQRFWPMNVLDDRRHQWQDNTVLALNDICPQVESLTPSKHEALLSSLDEEFNSSDFKVKAYELLGGAVRIPTESYDGPGLPSEDMRLKMIAKFHGYLELRFPKVHANLKRTEVNTYALVYEWKGTENTEPLLLAAHMDVVPVDPNTYDDWVYPPYSGHYDGERIWGRGSCDYKSGIIGSLTAVETLLERGFVPSRTVLLAFGFDEESGGYKGAQVIAQHLLAVYGPGSVAMVVDEGVRFIDLSGMVFASPGVTERGYMNVRMDVLTPGGHSSTPPKRTAIGILADLITEVEAHPHQPKLVRGGAYYQSLECRAKYDKDFPESLSKLLLESQTSDEKLQELENRLIDFDPDYYALSGTTQAVDLIGGGVKVNALPERAWAIVNHRIADHSSPTELIAHFTDTVLPIAGKHNMTLEAFGKTVEPQGSSWGTIRIHDFPDHTFGSPPVTPTTESGPYELLSGTIQSTIQTHLRSDSLPRTVVVSPGIMRGNSDARHYWNLTPHIFRYNHVRQGDCQGIHATNEAIRADSFLEYIRFFTRLILNADQSDLLD